ncbi:hypothetical protein Plhal703r1_c17g0078921 [Plasmopara halstedii]
MSPYPTDPIIRDTLTEGVKKHFQSDLGRVFLFRREEDPCRQRVAYNKLTSSNLKRLCIGRYSFCGKV